MKSAETSNWRERRPASAAAASSRDARRSSPTRTRAPAAKSWAAAPLRASGVASGGADYDHAGNRVHNQVSDGYSGTLQHRFTFDAWNRLTKIERAAGSGTPSYTTLADYTYNGLNWRTTKEVDKGGGVSEFRVYTYSANWQAILEEINDDRGAEEPAGGDIGTDRVAQQFFGLMGINNALYRREDRGTLPVADDEETEEVDESAAATPPDGIFEIKVYQLADPQGSIVACVRGRQVAESTEYEPYGRVRRRYGADFNQDGVLTAQDTYDFLAAWNASPPSALADFNESGSVTTQDLYDFMAAWGTGDAPGATPDAVSAPPVFGPGIIAGGLARGIDNPYGYCGYYFDRETVGVLGPDNGGLYSVRHRVYDPIAGRWMQRDPAGFVDGGNLYEYVGGRATAAGDPLGLWLECTATEMGNSDYAVVRGGAYVVGAFGAFWESVADSVTGTVTALAKAKADPLGTGMAIAQSAAEADANYAKRTGSEPSTLGTVHVLMLDMTGVGGIVEASYGYTAHEDRLLSTGERIESGVMGGLQVAMTVLRGPAAMRGAAASAATRSAPSSARWTAPKIASNRHGQLTNGKYILSDVGMQPHTTGSLAQGKSQFLYRVNEKQVVLDAAAYADEAGLWVMNKAKVVLDTPIGVHGQTGELTNVINIYRTNTGFVHGAPGTP